MNVGLAGFSLAVVKTVLASSLLVVSNSKVVVVSLTETVVVVSSPITSVVAVNPTVVSVVALSMTVMADSRVEDKSLTRS